VKPSVPPRRNVSPSGLLIMRNGKKIVADVRALVSSGRLHRVKDKHKSINRVAHRALEQEGTAR
jgi:hypothetical protein